MKATPTAARLDIHRAAEDYSDTDALLLGAIIRRLSGLLPRQKARVEALREPHGRPINVPATTRDEIADMELLAAWRAVAKAEGIEMAPPGSVGR